MRAKRRLHLEGPSAPRPVNCTDDDFQHLMECVDSGCWYCADEAEPQSERDPEVQAWLDAVEAQHTALAA